MTAERDGGPTAHGGVGLRVVKVGGDEILPGPALSSLARWVVRGTRAGSPMILVHGGGDEVTELARRLDVPTRKVQGHRVTTPEILPLVEGTLAGVVNLRLVRALEEAGIATVGLSGVSGGMVEAQWAGDPPGSLGFVGWPRRVDPTLLRLLLREGFLPVLAPLARGPSHEVLNVNADPFAAALAAALRADLWLLTDVPGVRGEAGEWLPELPEHVAQELLARGIASDGMVPKLQAALGALSSGVPRVRIGNLPAEGSPEPGKGTWVLRERPVPHAAPDASAGFPPASTIMSLPSQREAGT